VGGGFSERPEDCRQGVVEELRVRTLEDVEPLADEIRAAAVV
jgi:hypothetical protein